MTSLTEPEVHNISLRTLLDVDRATATSNLRRKMCEAVWFSRYATKWIDNQSGMLIITILRTSTDGEVTDTHFGHLGI